jgi:hypothetical protein
MCVLGRYRETLPRGFQHCARRPTAKAQRRRHSLTFLNSRVVRASSGRTSSEGCGRLPPLRLLFVEQAAIFIHDASGPPRGTLDHRIL